MVREGKDFTREWEMLEKAGKRDLRKTKEAILALEKVRKNYKLKELGFTDELLAKINGYNPASFDEILTDLDEMATFLSQNKIQLQNFQSTISILTGRNANYRQGVHWIIQDISKETSFANKNLVMEVSVNNARETFSFIDLVCTGCAGGKNLNIEYKSGLGSITKETIKKQFIERDLFNANSLNEIQWRMKNTSLTKEKLVEWLIEHKNSLDNNRILGLFENYRLASTTYNTSITNSNRLITFLESDSSWFNLIFK